MTTFLIVLGVLAYAAFITGMLAIIRAARMRCPHCGRYHTDEAEEFRCFLARRMDAEDCTEAL